MPTYICYTKPDLLTAEQRRQLAEGITGVHARQTGAPASFCQVLFQELRADDRHFIGGRPADRATVFVHGSIRDGRPAEMKHRLLAGLRDVIVRTTGVAGEHVWVYLAELSPRQMIEFGQVLPEHGAEQAWMDALPRGLHERLRTLESRDSDETRGSNSPAATSTDSST